MYAAAGLDALAEAGLIRLVDTRQVRGTVEKYYKAVGRAFRADPGIFCQADTDDEQNQTLANVATTMLERTTEKVRNLILSGHYLTSGEEGILSYVEVRASEDDRRYRLNLAWLPLDNPGDGPSEP